MDIIKQVRLDELFYIAAERELTKEEDKEMLELLEKRYDLEQS